MDSNTAMHIARKQVAKDAEEAMIALINSTNIMGQDAAVIEGIVAAMVKAHPTLAQSFIRAFLGATSLLAYDDRFGRDARSEASKEVLKRIDKATDDVYIPFT